ncbi:MAG: hypothetical protein PHY92_04125 [Alphaproteobacteria bacterium]|nr:hypothetical protein [Alphaproteobacteria bacterium]
MRDTRKLRDGTTVDREEAGLAYSNLRTFTDMETRETTRKLIEFAQGKRGDLPSDVLERLKYHELTQPDGTVSETVKKVILLSIRGDGNSYEIVTPFDHSGSGPQFRLGL